MSQHVQCPERDFNKGTFFSGVWKGLIGLRRVSEDQGDYQCWEAVTALRFEGTKRVNGENSARAVSMKRVIQPEWGLWRGLPKSPNLISQGKGRQDKLGLSVATQRVSCNWWNPVGREKFRRPGNSIQSGQIKSNLVPSTLQSFTSLPFSYFQEEHFIKFWKLRNMNLNFQDWGLGMQFR